MSSRRQKDYAKMDSVKQALSGEFLIHDYPFRHLTWTNALTRSEFETVCQASDHAASAVGPVLLPGYGAHVYSLGQKERQLLGPLSSSEWLGALARALGVPCSFNIDAAFHTHPPGSPSGWLHNDFNPGWFPLAQSGKAEVFSDHQKCCYRTGRLSEGEAGVELARAIAIILYLDSENVAEEDGGQTLLRESYTWVGSRDRNVFPVPNTLLAFECTPDSWHAFQATGRRRKTVMMWLHRSLESQISLWPGHKLVKW